MGALKTQEVHCWFNLQGKELLVEAPEDQLLFFPVSDAAAPSQHRGSCLQLPAFAGSLWPAVLASQLHRG